MKFAESTRGVSENFPVLNIDYKFLTMQENQKKDNVSV